MKKPLIFLLLIICLVSFLEPGFCDALIVVKAMTATTVAEIFIQEDRVRLELEIGMEDIEAFKNILPNDIYERLGNDPLPLKKRLKTFLEKEFVFNADNKQLKGYLVEINPRIRIKRDEITGEPLPIENQEQETVVFAVIEYPFKGKPKTVMMKPPLNSAGYVVATIGFVTYHLGLAVNDFRYLARAETLTLDWQDPWYSQFSRRPLLRRYKEPMSVFIYVEPFEVRKEIIVRPKDLQQWLDLGLEGKKIIKAEEHEQIKKKVAEFFASRDPMLIDGKKASGILDRIHFIRRTLRTTSVVDPPEDLPLHSATLGVIFVYPITGLPQEVSMEWSLFNGKIQKVNAATADEAGGFPYSLGPEDPVLVWNNFLKNPTIPSLVDLKPPEDVVYARIFGIPNPFAKYWRINSKDADAVTLGLLKNIYHAFDYRAESDTYDVLRESAIGDLLTQIYLEARRSLVLKVQGGAKVKVKEVELVNTEVENIKGEVGFKTHCKWDVSGSVGHWGHIHIRKNQYDAILTVKAVDGEWKITELEILNEQRL